MFHGHVKSHIPYLCLHVFIHFFSFFNSETKTFYNTILPVWLNIVGDKLPLQNKAPALWLPLMFWVTETVTIRQVSGWKRANFLNLSENKTRSTDLLVTSQSLSCEHTRRSRRKTLGEKDDEQETLAWSPKLQVYIQPTDDQNTNLPRATHTHTHVPSVDAYQTC